MSNIQQNFNAGQTHGQTQASAEDHLSSAKNSAAQAAKQANEAAHSSGGQAQRHTEEATGFLQQTGEQVKNMAQGAVDSVKHTLGMDKNN